MANPTDSLDAVAQALIEIVKASNLVDVKDVWYGDESNIPRTPAVSVDPDILTSEVIETGYTTRNDFTVIVTMYHSRLDAPGVTRKETLQKAEQLKAVLNSDRTLGGLVVYGYVGEIAPGFSARGRAILRATRLVWTGFNKTRMV